MNDGHLEIADWRRRVVAMWLAWRQGSVADAKSATRRFRSDKDRLFADHPQSPLLPGERATFRGLAYWPYDPAWRMTVAFETIGEEPAATAAPAPSSFGGFAPVALPNSGNEAIASRKIGRVTLPGPLAGQTLPVFWIVGYGGGIFLPFRDGTAGTDTYGAGRYLLDTIKGADQGSDHQAGTLLLDFNMAYHPSCAYDPRWTCPLAPPESRLTVPVPVGERLHPAR